MEINIKIVGVEGDSVLVKYASENSKYSIDEYEAVAYQPKSMGYGTLDAFIKGINPQITNIVKERDAAEQISVNLQSWVNAEKTFTSTDIPVPDVVAPDGGIILPNATPDAEVIL